MRVSYFETSNGEDRKLFSGGGVAGLRIVEELGPESIILSGGLKGGGDLEEK